MLDAYIQKLPDSVNDFYLRALAVTPPAGPWCARVKVGVNTLKKFIPDEKSGHKSVKALCSYESTSMYQEEVAGTISGQRLSLETIHPEATTLPETIPSATETLPPNPSVPTFSGVNNCTFNLYSK